MASTSNEELNEILYVSFNQDYSRFTVGTETGFRVYETQPLAVAFARDPLPQGAGGVGMVEVYYQTNTVVLVGGGKRPAWDNHVLIFWDDYLGKKVGQHEFHHPIRSVKLTRTRVFAATDTRVAVFAWQDLQLLRTVETTPNPLGCLAVCPEALRFACPGQVTGDVYFNAAPAGAEHWPHTSTRPPARESSKKAHSHAVSVLALSGDGAWLATASEHGTIVRLWQVAAADGLLKDPCKEFRRGGEPTTITSIVFNHNASFFLVTSGKKTIHVFSLRDDIPNATLSIARMLGSFTSPSSWSPVWSCLQIDANIDPLEAGAAHRAACFAPPHPDDPNQFSIIVVSFNGIHFVQTFKLTPGLPPAPIAEFSKDFLDLPL